MGQLRVHDEAHESPGRKDCLPGNQRSDMTTKNAARIPNVYSAFVININRRHVKKISSESHTFVVS